MQQDRIDAARAAPVAAADHFIDGDWDSGTGATLDVVSPIDGQVLTTIADGTPDDMTRAIAHARAAFDDGRWCRMPPATRKKIMHRIADTIEDRALDLAVLGVRDNGTEISMAINAEPGSAAATFRYYAECIDKIYGEVAPTRSDILALVHREPIGVVGAIIPWNFPLMIGAWKIAAALAAGNSVVVKPAESASLSLTQLVAICSQAGLPDGVLNIVTGKGSVVGETLALSMEVDVLAFTGSGGTGRRLLEYAARSNLKRCYLELGGKSANVVFADAPDLDVAAKATAAAIFRNAGQVCVAGSRLLVQADVHDDFVASVRKHAVALRVGDPLDMTTQVGAVHSAQQLAQNLTFVDQARAEGAEIITGGSSILNDTGGFYMAPTIATGVARHHRLFQDEVFGPVLSVTPFTTEDEAVSLANGTVFGLAGAVWTANHSRAHRMVKSIRAGVMHVNCYGGADVTVPLAGMRQSGNGADKSLHALDKYLEHKTAWMQL